jgi:hypothetical protein
LDKQRKVSRPPLRGTKPAKASPEGECVRPPWRSPLQHNQDSNSKIKLDPSFRWDDEQEQTLG